ncbi:hypothetical protein [Tolumonas osonensis]|uniref:Uncharacterized protein n=1 Tax=Tolumonas osonensis TaxID=675874 RepID=A0A841GGX3_9GAMM|nr:hypothetical protein [Tolumonas osonensis]MBB6054501.1 hypothetical protein [Tolumonas osonensis]
MKYDKIIEKINSKTLSRAELSKIKQNAELKNRQGDTDAIHVINAIHQATPADAYILFMGFCPSADIHNRLDIEWRQKGICRFDFLESEHQAARFNTICAGDLVILKKREQFGKTMKLYGHGRVTGVAYDKDNIRYLTMNWSEQDKVIEVPLIGCNSTVDVKSIELVENEMPNEFYEWLNT